MTLGYAERSPFVDASFDLVVAVSVIEHADDPDAVFREVHRVLRPGGGSTSIPRVLSAHGRTRGTGSPVWYPTPLKRRILDWAKTSRPAVIGNTDRPAHHWFTPWDIKRRLRAVGFGEIIDRWELRRDEESTGARLMLQRVLQSSGVLRFAADVAVPESGYLAVRGR